MTARAPELALSALSSLSVRPALAVQLAAEAGFASVGLRLRPVGDEPERDLLHPAGRALRSVTRALQDAGLGVLDVEAVAFRDTGETTPMQPFVEVAAALGAQMITAVSFDPDLGRTAEHIARWSEAAAELGIAFALEFMAFSSVRSPRQALAVLESSGRRDAGIVVDTLHMARTGTPLAALRDVPAERIRLAQLCDASTGGLQVDAASAYEEAVSGRLAPGEGVLAIRGTVRLLPKGVPLTVEVPQPAGITAEAHIRHLFDATTAVLVGSG
jgi:sugar phosphate isomerase/epimerase